MNLRMWCEFVSPRDLCKPFITEILKKYNVVLNYKLEYGKHDDEDFFTMLKIYNEKHIPVSLWLTLPDEEGYWINEQNVDKFEIHVDNILEKVEMKYLKIQGICIDMEPPLNDVLRIHNSMNRLTSLFIILKGLLFNITYKRFKYASQVLERIAIKLKDKGLEGYATAARYCYYDLKFESNLIQNLFETPFFNIPWSKHNLMYYSSMMRKELKDKNLDIQYFIYRQIKEPKNILGDKLSISLGVLNTGKLVNEEFYDDNLEDLKKDVAILKECNVNDVSFYSLDGLMNKEKLESFLNIIVLTPPYNPRICSNYEKSQKYNKKLYSIINTYYKVFK